MMNCISTPKCAIISTPRVYGYINTQHPRVRFCQHPRVRFWYVYGTNDRTTTAGDVYMSVLRTYAEEHSYHGDTEHGGGGALPGLPPMRGQLSAGRLVRRARRVSHTRRDAICGKHTHTHKREDRQFSQV